MIQNYSYIGPVVGIRHVYIPIDKLNRRVPLTDQVGINNLLLTPEQDNYLKALSTDNYNTLISNKYLVRTLSGRMRLFMYAFEYNTVVITYQKGDYSRLLSIGTRPEVSEAYYLQSLSLNPCTLGHCFMKGMGVVLPLFQPPKLSNGEDNYFSIRTEYLL